MEVKHFFKPIEEDLLRVEQEVRDQVSQIILKTPPNDRVYIEEIVQHLFHVTGKLLRPAMLLLSANIETGRSTSHSRSSGRRTAPVPHVLIQMSAAVELLHSASLIHDDVIDEAVERRSQTSLNKAYGNKIAVLVGDMLHSQFFYLLTRLDVVSWDRKEFLFCLFWNVSQRMCMGEISQQQYVRGESSPELEDYLNILENKTAMLMSACCESGALLGSNNPETVGELREFGRCFGMAYQLIDDYLDRDGIYKTRFGLFDKVDHYIAKAKSIVEAYSGSPAASHLASLCDFLIKRAEQPLEHPSITVQ